MFFLPLLLTEKTVAHSIMERVINSSGEITLVGESMREDTLVTLNCCLFAKKQWLHSETPVPFEGVNIVRIYIYCRRCMKMYKNWGIIGVITLIFLFLYLIRQINQLKEPV